MAKKYVKSIKFSQSGETYYIRDAEAKDRLDTLEPSVQDLEATVASKQDKLTAGANITIENNVISATGGGTGAVESVNGKTGVVNLSASDVHAATEAQGALADTAVQPAAIADMATKTELSVKQDKLTSANAGTNVTITEDAGVVKINATGSLSTVNWGGIEGTLSNQADLQEALNAKASSSDLAGKQDKLTSANAGTNVTITEESGVVKINATGSGGVSNYSDLNNTPSIENHPLNGGNNTAASLGLATSSELSGKQDTINDLADIRSGAAAGATALQSDDLMTINNTSLVGSGNIECLTSSDVGTMAAEDKDDYYTKTDADAEFLSSNQGSENAGKILGIDASGDVISATKNDLNIAGTHTGYSKNLYNKDSGEDYHGFMNGGSTDGIPNPPFTESTRGYWMTHKIYLDSTKTYRMNFNTLTTYGTSSYHSDNIDACVVGLAYWDEANDRWIGYRSPNYTHFVSIEGQNFGILSYCDIHAPVSGEYRINFYVNSTWPKSSFMITELEDWPEGYPLDLSKYIPYAEYKDLDSNVRIPDLVALQEEVDAMDLSNKVDYHTYPGVNLFNPANIVLNKRISYNSKPATNSGSCISGPIPVKPNTWYHWHKGAQRGSERTLAIYDSIGNVVYAQEAYYDSGNPMRKQSGTNNILIDYSGKFLTPSNASYVQFNISWYGDTSDNTFQEGDQNDYELEEGETWTGPNPWVDPYKAIDPADLKPEFRDLPERMDSAEAAIDAIIESSGSMTVIDAYNSDKIGFFSNSFLNGYAMQGQHTIQRVMQFCDYVGYNYSISGYDMVELAAKMNRNETFLGSCKPSEIGPLKYGVIMHQDNDGIVYSMNHRSYYENAKHLGYAIRSLGGEPVISTEHDWAANYQIFQRLCQDEGWEFLPWGKEAAAEDPSPRYAPFWHSGHPATRTGWLQVYGFLPFVMSRPRPQKSMKLFRLRSTTDDSDINNLLYNTILERWDRWQEIRTGQSGLTVAAEKYFDRWGTTGYGTQNWPCEYQKLIKHESVSFGNYLLADVTTPYNSHSVTYGKFEITGTGVEHVYARKIRYMDPCWLPSSAANYLSFGVTAGIENLPVGTQFTVSGITREDGTNINGVTFTVGSVLDGMVVTTTPQGTTYTTSGTDTPVCSISGVTMAGTYSYPNPDYAAKWNTPLGQWEELTMTATSNGWEVELTSEQLEKYSDEDKFVFMASGTDITITDIKFTCAGTSEKLLLENKRVLPKVQKGTNALASTYMKTADETNWTNLSNIATVTPITDGTYTETYPDSLTPRNFMTGDWVAQKIDASVLTQTKWKKPTRIQVQVLARYFPPYVLNDEDFATSGVTEDCTFTGKLEVQLATSSSLPAEKAQNPITTFYVGGWWHVHTFDYDVINSTYNYLFLKALDDNIQIGAVWVVSADSADGKQDTLISGTNIKTINGVDILGSGDVTIQGIDGNYVEYDEIQSANLFNKDSSDNLLGYFCNSGSNAGTTVTSFNAGSGYALTHLMHFKAGDVVRTFFGATSSYGGYSADNPTAYRIAYVRLKDDGSGNYVGYKGTDTATVTVIDGVSPTSAMYADITIPVTGDYRFNYIRTESALMGPNYFMVTKLSEWPEGYPADTTKYVPYSYEKVVKDEYTYPPIEDMQTQVDGFQAQLDAIDVDNKVDYTHYNPVNLFDPAGIILGQCFDYNGTPHAKEGACISGLIPVKPNTWYYWKKGAQRGSERTARFVKANGTTTTFAVEAYKADGTEMGKVSSTGKYLLSQTGYFLSPDDAAYFQFNISWYGDTSGYTYQPGDEADYEFQEGQTYTGPNTYFEPYRAVAPEDLTPEYQELPSRVEDLENKVGTAVANATDTSDVVTQFNLLLSSLRSAGLISAS